MSETIEVVARRWWEEGLNKHNADLADELMDADYVLHESSFGDIKGRKAFKQFVAGLFVAFPDTYCTVEQIVSAGEECAVRATFSGTHLGEFMGIAPTGNRITDVSGIVTIRIRGGRHVEAWQAFDFLGMLRQLGAAPGATDANKALVHRYMEEIWHQGSLAVVDEVFSADSVFYGPSLPRLQGREARKEFVAASREASSDLHFDIDEMIAEGNKVVMRWSSTQTHRGELFGAAPTGRRVFGNGTSTFRIAGGMIAEEFVQMDTLSFMQQLGLVPASSQAAQAAQ